jgi:hypothetical protein
MRTFLGDTDAELAGPIMVASPGVYSWWIAGFVPAAHRVNLVSPSVSCPRRYRQKTMCESDRNTSMVQR